MKLSELVEHTGLWLGYSATSIGSYARFLREARQISGGVKGGGAADMTDSDKISLLVAVLGCGTARTCAKDLPGLLSVKPSKILKSSDSEALGDVEDPAFFSQPDLKSALLAMFRDIQSGSLDDWRRRVESELSKMNVIGPMVLGLTITFEIDANHVSVRLRANGGMGKQPKLRITVGPDMEFGAPRATNVAGYSRRFHEISHERLVGWGACLLDDGADA